jgi:hypothetical protein
MTGPVDDDQHTPP